ncbi:MAG: hypothetical protein M1818_002786 [Claussenomyces sp. TS43310]|nr:MAG: hypothetical protein M1818_002786 [Claussenomyces sp. TS43310]
MSSSDSTDPIYTVLIRVPFPRGNFVDPPPIDWDAAKDKSLWKILSKASKNSDVDWTALATKFDVSLPFLLQQAAWLYERQLSQVRAQMRKVGAVRGSTSPLPGSDSAGGETMRRTGSGGGGPRIPSSLSVRKDSPMLRNDATATPSRSMAPPFSRTSSASTTVQIQSRNAPQSSPQLAKAALNRRSISPPARTAPTKGPSDTQGTSSESASSESSSDSEVLAKSRILRRPPRFSSHKLGLSEDADDDDDAPAFLPFSAPADSNAHDPSATLKGDLRHMPRRISSKKPEDIQRSQTSDSSASSAAPVVRPGRNEVHQMAKHTGPLSPRRTAELAGRSPMNKGKGTGREGSDGSPSMGSSFSDLDG